MNRIDNFTKNEIAFIEFAKVKINEKLFLNDIFQFNKKNNIQNELIWITLSKDKNVFPPIPRIWIDNGVDINFARLDDIFN